MQAYESIFILRPTLSDEDVAKTMEKLKALAEKGGCAEMKVHNWGKRKLAYHIKKEKRGTYIIFQFMGNGKAITDLERSYAVEDSILKYITVRVPKGDSGALPTTSPDEGRPFRGRAGYDRR